MGLTRRAARPLRDNKSARYDPKGVDKKNRAAFVAPLTILLVLVALIRILIKQPHGFPDMPLNAARLEEKVGLGLEFQHANKQNVTQGPHVVNLVIAKPCEDPRFVMRLTGDEAVFSVPVLQVDKYHWKGTFTIPLPGIYQVEPRWYGCSRDGEAFQGEVTKISVTGKREGRNKRKRWSVSHTTLPDLIPEGYWASPKLYGDMANKRFWVSRDLGLEQPNFIVSNTEAYGESTVAKEATPIAREFGELSNYELVCFVGSQSANVLWESFRSIRPSVAQHQKPFKFHHYPVDDFREPDAEWDDELKRRIRKCKNIIVSIDELKEPLVSQEEYKSQVTTFLSHMVKMFDDETFPIWMLTVNLPANSNSKMCTALPALYKRSNHHACNDVLIDIFRNNAFGNNRVRLLDNTDLIDPLLDEGMQDGIAVIAMRIFTIVGDQVKTWRKAGQKGTKEGLHRNGVLEPNIDFSAYNFKTRAL